MRVRLSENAPKADSRNANPVPAMVEVVEPARASGSCVCRVGASSTVSSCVGSGSGSSSVTGIGICSSEGIIGTGIGSDFVVGTGVGSGFGGSGLGGSGFGFGLVTVTFFTKLIPIVSVAVLGT